MSQFNIFNMASGEELGRYFARSLNDALDAMAQVAGFKDYQDACQACPSMPVQLMVTEL